jgi:diacylglycerol kinase family enzyme
VIANRHAGGVTAPLIDAMKRLLGAEQVFVTDSVEAATSAIAAIVAAGHEVVCSGGGDGTFVQAVTDLAALRADPILFGLRLGSGNAIADVCGAGPPTVAGLTRDVARAAGDEPPGELPMLVVDGRLTHSVGFGLDAEYNLDLDRVAKAGRRSRWLRPLVAGALGMYATGVVRTLPRLVRRRAPRVRITALDEAWRIDGRGRTLEILPPGATLHDGPVTIAAASTARTYGRGVVFFPFTEAAPGRFQLRVAHVGAGEAVRNLVHIRRGAHARLTGIDDFLVGGARVETLDRCAAHRAGEVWFPDAAVTVTLAPARVRVLRGGDGSGGVLSRGGSGRSSAGAGPGRRRRRGSRRRRSGRRGGRSGGGGARDRRRRTACDRRCRARGPAPGAAG